MSPCMASIGRDDGVDLKRQDSGAGSSRPSIPWRDRN